MDSITIDCRNGQTEPMSEAFLQMAGVLSQLELAMIRVERGMENEKAKGEKDRKTENNQGGYPNSVFQALPHLCGRQDECE